jgi:hypothetical protein
VRIIRARVYAGKDGSNYDGTKENLQVIFQLAGLAFEHFTIATLNEPYDMEA